MLNVFTEFMALMPTRPLQVGTVVAVVSGVRTVELAGGGQLQVRGTAAVGERVYVRDGAIEGPAPVLTYSAGEV